MHPIKLMENRNTINESQYNRTQKEVKVNHSKEINGFHKFLCFYIKLSERAKERAQKSRCIMIRSTPIHSPLVILWLHFQEIVRNRRRERNIVKETAISSRYLSVMLSKFLIKLSMLFRDFSNAIHSFKPKMVVRIATGAFFLSKLSYARRKVAVHWMQSTNRHKRNRINVNKSID